MALLFIDGFGSYSSQYGNIDVSQFWWGNALTFNLGVSLQYWYGNNRGQWLDVNQSAAGSAPYTTNRTEDKCPRRSLMGDHSELTVGFRAYYGVPFGGGLATCATMVFENNDAPQVGIMFKGDGSIDVIRYSSSTSGTVLGSTPAGTHVMSARSFYEFSTKIDATDGSFKLSVNGTEILNITGVNTQGDVTAATANTIRFGNLDVNHVPFLITDVYVRNDLTQYGHVTIERVIPMGDVDTTGFVSHVEGGSLSYAVAEMGPYSSHKVYGSEMNSELLFNISNLITAPASVKALRMFVVANATARPRTVAMQFKSGESVVEFNKTFKGVIRDEERIYDQYLENDPATSNPFTAAALQAIQIGLKIKD